MMSGNVQQNPKHIFEYLYAGYGTNIRVGEGSLYFFNVQICTILRFHLGN